MGCDDGGKQAVTSEDVLLKVSIHVNLMQRGGGVERTLGRVSTNPIGTRLLWVHHRSGSLPFLFPFPSTRERGSPTQTPRQNKYINLVVYHVNKASTTGYSSLHAVR